MRFKLSAFFSLAAILLIYLFHVRYGLLVDPPSWPDESIYTDIALNIKQGISQGSSLWQDYMPQAKNYALWYPRLYFHLLSIWLFLLPPTLLSLRALSVISGALVLILTFFISLKLTHKLSLAIFISLALSLDYAFIRAARLGRPEILCLVLILSAVFLLIRSQKSGIWCLASGVLAALSALIHPLTLFAGLISLPLIKTKAYFLYFWAGFSVVILVFALSSFSLLPTLFLQFQTVYQRKTFELPWLILVLYQEPFVHRLIYFCYLVITLIFLASALKKRQFTYSIIFMALLAGWLQSLIGRMIWYSVAFIPFLYLATALLLKEKNILLRSYAHLSAVILISLNLYFSLNQTQIRNRQYTQIGEMTQEIIKLIPKGSRVLLSSVPDPYFALKDSGYQLREFPSLAIDPEQYLSILNQTEYVIFSENLTPELFGNLLPQFLDENKAWSKTISNGHNLILYVVKLKTQN